MEQELQSLRTENENLKKQQQQQQQQLHHQQQQQQSSSSTTTATTTTNLVANKSRPFGGKLDLFISTIN